MSGHAPALTDRYRPAFRWRLWQVMLWAIGIGAALATAVIVAAAILSGGATDAVLWISLGLWTMLLGGAVGAVMGLLALLLRALAGTAPVVLLRVLLAVATGLATAAAFVWATGAASLPLLVLVAIVLGLAGGWSAQHITFARRRAGAAA